MYFGFGELPEFTVITRTPEFLAVGGGLAHELSRFHPFIAGSSFSYTVGRTNVSIVASDGAGTIRLGPRNRSGRRRLQRQQLRGGGATLPQVAGGSGTLALERGAAGH